MAKVAGKGKILSSGSTLTPFYCKYGMCSVGSEVPRVAQQGSTLGCVPNFERCIYHLVECSWMQERKSNRARYSISDAALTFAV